MQLGQATRERQADVYERGLDDAEHAIAALDEAIAEEPVESAYASLDATYLSRLETIDVDQIESGGAHHVVQYRGEIMPLLHASEVLPERRSRMRSTGQQEEPTADP